ncbi:NAD(P)-dependent oxidoreductase [Akkermansiaceae bacterium]|nr:NAD(P)-dependent oxidoreductase [Akkermansiaceae bacterium]MDB4423411.1 NAD(P)-dependent oxidoreductase [bacterium]
MRVLLTGSSGLIGKRVRIELIRLNYEVISIGRCPEANDHIVDLTDEDAVKAVCSKIRTVDCVLHLAAKAHGLGQTSKKELIKQNFSATKYLINAISAHFEIGKIHFILASTTAVLDASEKLPLSPYAQSKVMAEDLVINSGFGAVSVLRFAAVYSDEILQDISKRVFIPGTRIKVLLISSPQYCLCHVKTAVAAVLQRVGYREKCVTKVICEPQLLSQSRLSKLIPGWFSLPFPKCLVQIFGSVLLSSRITVFMALGNMVNKVVNPIDYREIGR